ncbi:Hpt domain-containing protein [Suttonella sp. R2A3]|uniref:Hpt domain-containing protein n=1 Tax=Suttonella sp. R2A3 TaxID=2908648 RepID=UPI001F32E169|nr:Hpt domain-containing protein [Suttonella sp. R2A3]UJF25295.1 Hpt domain-containing protein [Suttonella sp. R2A3]
MANSMDGKLLSSVKNEIITNIADVRERVDQWLLRPESIAVEPITARLNEVAGSLMLLQRHHSAQLAQKLSALMSHFSALSRDDLQQQLAESSQDIAISILVLSDVIDEIDHPEDAVKKHIEDALLQVGQLLRGEDQKAGEELFADVSASHQTLAVLAQEYRKIIDQHCVLIERHLDDQQVDLNIAKIIEDNNELSKVFALLEYEAPQLLLAKINERLAQESLDEAQWVDVAESMLLVRDALGATLAKLSADSEKVGSYVDALQASTTGSRGLEVGQALLSLGREGEHIFASLRKAYLADDGDVSERQWRDAAGFCLEAEAFTYLLNLPKISQHLRHSGLLFTYLTRHKDAEIPDEDLIDLLVGLEYLCHSLDGGKTDTQERFLHDTLEALNVSAWIDEDVLSDYQQLNSRTAEQLQDERHQDEPTLADLDSALDAQDAQSQLITDEGGFTIATDSPISALIQSGDVAKLRETVMPERYDDLLKEQRDNELDEELSEIFSEELSEIIDEVQPLIRRWITGEESAIKEIRRALHTLKGSGRMAGYLALGECAWQHEHLLNQCIDDSLTIDHEIKAIGVEAIQLLTLAALEKISLTLMQHYLLKRSLPNNVWQNCSHQRQKPCMNLMLIKRLRAN